MPTSCPRDPVSHSVKPLSRTTGPDLLRRNRSPSLHTRFGGRQQGTCRRHCRVAKPPENGGGSRHRDALADPRDWSAACPGRGSGLLVFRSLLRCSTPWQRAQGPKRFTLLHAQNVVLRDQGLGAGLRGTGSLSVPGPRSLVFLQVRGFLLSYVGTEGTEKRNYDVDKTCIRTRARIRNTHQLQLIMAKFSPYGPCSSRVYFSDLQ